jgi:hypothetical protein
MGTVLNRESIFGIPDIKTEEVYVAEWGGSVTVRGLTAAGRDAYEASIISHNGKKVQLDKRNIRAKLVVMSVIDADGKRMFSDGDATALGEKNAAALDTIYAVAARLSGLSAADEEELAKNSGRDSTDDSPSA